MLGGNYLRKIIMGIRIKNTAEYDETLLNRANPLAVATGVTQVMVPANGYIKAILAEIGTPGTDGTGAPTQDLRVDIKRVPIATGVAASIFVSATPYIAWAHARFIGGTIPLLPSTYDGQISAPGVSDPAVQVLKGDIIRVDVLQILNGTSPTQPSDLNILLVFSRGQLWAPEGTLLGTFSELDT
jgi:hypothetical protein